jgi:putative ABC transport system permease protein
MGAVRRLFWRCVNLFRPNRAEGEFTREIASHLALLEDEFIQRGFTVDEARREARRALGGVTQTKEQHREARSFGALGDLRRDVIYALRMLRRAPGFTFVAVIVLALGIGANTAIFSVVHTVLLTPLPYHNADRFVRLMEQPDSTDSPSRRFAGVTRSELDTLRSRARTVSHLGVYVPTTMTLSGPGEAAHVDGIKISPTVFAMLGETPRIGRTFEPGEEAHGSDQVVILSDTMWQRHCGGDPNVLGRSLSFDGVPYSVVGVMGPGFHFPDVDTQFWVPFAWPAGARLVLTGQLQSGASIQAASDEVTMILRQERLDPRTAWIALGLPEPPPPPPPPGSVARKVRHPAPPPGSAPSSASTPPVRTPAFRFVGLAEQAIAPVRPALGVLSAAVGLVLLIATVNVGNLMLARAAARAHEMAVRTALGASRARLMRQVLTEGVVLSALGGAAGIGVALGGLRLLQTLGTAAAGRDLAWSFSLPRLNEVGLDSATLQFGVALSLATGGLVGLMVALRQSRPDQTDVLREQHAAVSGFDLFRRHRVRGLSIVAQMAMAVLLCIGGWLLIDSFVKLSRVDPGYDTSHVLTFQVALPPGRVVLPFLDDLMARLQARPGVRAAGYADQLPLSLRWSTVPLRTTPAPPVIPPAPAAPGMSNPPEFPAAQIVSPGFLDAIGVRVIDGRGLSDAERAGPRRPLLVSRTLAQSGFLGAHPIGMQVFAAGSAPSEIVGIVADTHEHGLEQDPGSQVFLTYRELPSGEALASASPPHVAVRTVGAPAAMTAPIRSILKQMDEHSAMDNVETMEQVVSATLVRPRVYAVFLGLFAAVAAILAVVGVAGAVSFSVIQRTHEIGVRLALGAGRWQVLSVVLRQSIVLTAVGLTVGILCAAILTRYLQALLFGLSRLDPVTFVAAPLAFSAVVVMAVLLSARRALIVDPLIALRHE